MREKIVVWLKTIANDGGMTYERRFKAIELLLAMEEL